jgi:hypothetical protein
MQARRRKKGNMRVNYYYFLTPYYGLHGFSGDHTAVTMLLQGILGDSTVNRPGRAPGDLCQEYDLQRLGGDTRSGRQHISPLWRARHSVNQGQSHSELISPSFKMGLPRNHPRNVDTPFLVLWFCRRDRSCFYADVGEQRHVAVNRQIFDRLCIKHWQSGDRSLHILLPPPSFFSLSSRPSLFFYYSFVY